jgi:putative transposase
VKKKRFSVEQITGILKQPELGTPITELCRQHGVSEQSYYRWKKIYGGMEPSEARELKQLRDDERLVSNAHSPNAYALLGSEVVGISLLHPKRSVPLVEIAGRSNPRLCRRCQPRPRASPAVTWPPPPLARAVEPQWCRS